MEVIIAGIIRREFTTSMSIVITKNSATLRGFLPACVNVDYHTAAGSLICCDRRRSSDLNRGGGGRITRFLMSVCSSVFSRRPAELRAGDWARPAAQESAACREEEDDADTDLTYGEVEQRLDLLQQHLNRCVCQRVILPEDR